MFNCYVNEHGRPPSVKELATACGFSTPSGVYRYLLRLKTAGKIVWEPNHPRTMRATGNG